MTRRCECCNRILPEVHKGRKFCPSCSIFVHSLRAKISYLNREIKTLRKILYGTPKGSERIILEGRGSPAIKMAYKRGYEDGKNAKS